ncbi:MAG TPA: response regulator [bacterium]|nr:response regulator [bacterium]
METRLLYVEDNRNLAEFVGQHLKELRPSWMVMPAHSCGEARSMLSREAVPDAAVLDVNLPDGNGVDLLGELKAANPRLPVIMVSGACSDDLFSRVVRRGAYTLIEKPFSMMDLVFNIESAVRLAALPRGGKVVTALALREKNQAIALRPQNRQIALYAPQALYSCLLTR